MRSLAKKCSSYVDTHLRSSIDMYSWTGTSIFARDSQYKLLYTDKNLCFLHTTWFYLLPISLTMFRRNSNVMEISCFSSPNSNESIVTKFRTLHGSCVVLGCVNICSNILARNRYTVKRNAYWIWLLMEKALVNWVPDYSYQSIKAILFIWIAFNGAWFPWI